jgi:hypothetical protein
MKNYIYIIATILFIIICICKIDKSDLTGKTYIVKFHNREKELSSIKLINKANTQYNSEVNYKKYNTLAQERKREIKAFIDTGFDNSPYNSARKFFNEDDVLYFKELIDEYDDVDSWDVLVQYWGWITKKPESVQYLLNFIIRDDSSLSKYTSICNAKRISLESIGIIGGDLAQSILKDAFTKNGAMYLTKEWINKPLSEPWKNKPDYMIVYMQLAAATGLIYSRNYESVEYVKAQYIKEHIYYKSNTNNIVKRYKQEQATKEEMLNIIYYQGLVEAMALDELLNKYGIEGYLKMDYQKNYQETGELLNKYSAIKE